ncbi:hypothetical protein [Pseudooceanicola onchidii]|nr:hypothetical protein [Pseudooceanicola onchidii]
MPSSTVVLTSQSQETPMNRIIYIVGLVVIVLAILSFIGIG